MKQDTKLAGSDKKNSIVLYEIQVGGIKCTNCAKKITGNLDKIDGVVKISVNVLAEKVQVVFYSETITLE